MAVVTRRLTLEISLTRLQAADRFQQVIGFTDSVHIFHDETSAFEHAAELQIGLGARHSMDYPLHSRELAELTYRFANEAGEMRTPSPPPLDLCNFDHQ